MLTIHNPDTIYTPVAHYGQGIEIPAGGRLLYVAGMVGMTKEGLMELGFEAQHRRIWLNTIEVLKAANMGVEDIIKLNVYSLDPADVYMVSSGRKEFLGAHIPPSTYCAVVGLARPEMLVEMETIAAKVD